VLIAAEAAGICGTDVYIAQWTAGYEALRAATPVAIGHKFAGRVTALARGDWRCRRAARHPCVPLPGHVIRFVQGNATFCSP
jgi:threonine dehydrogenase-like Zn-dependent dehydrogenase